MENFIHSYQISDLNLCDSLINYFHSNNEYKLQGAVDGGKVNKDWKNSIDLTILPWSNADCIKDYYSHLNIAYNQYIKKYPYSPKNVHTKETMNIQYYPIGGGYPKWHYERNDNDTMAVTRALVFMTYLNDVPDGGTEWYYQQHKVEAKKGLTLIWPTDYTHTHRGIISKTHEKYIITGWFNFY